jgi:hypothetical protein
MIASEGLLAPNGKIWLPNLNCIHDKLDEFQETLCEFYEICYERNPLNNPLFLATEDVERELMLCPDVLTNDNQMKPLYDYSKYPFCYLRMKTFGESKRSPLKLKRTRLSFEGL